LGGRGFSRADQPNQDAGFSPLGDAQEAAMAVSEEKRKKAETRCLRAWRCGLRACWFCSICRQDTGTDTRGGLPPSWSCWQRSAPAWWYADGEYGGRVVRGELRANGITCGNTVAGTPELKVPRLRVKSASRISRSARDDRFENRDDRVWKQL